MPYLSRPIGELKSHYDVVIIGSGYGGGAVAYRLAAAQHAAAEDARLRGITTAVSVCVLERGEEWRTGDFPVSPTEALAQLQVDHPLFQAGPSTGLFDLRVWPEMAVLVGCGLGGTSLINANVMIPAEPDAFTGWPTLPMLPDEQERNWTTELRPFYLKAARALRTSPTPSQLALAKRSNLWRAGEPFETPSASGEGYRSPPLAVSFSNGTNQFGVARRQCQLCGDCVTGCNHDAKNTVDRNYLAGARNHGAEIYCGISVDSVEPVSASSDIAPNGTGAAGWLIHARVLDKVGRRFRTFALPIRAKTVFIAAGAIGSTEILWRSRKRHDLKLSSQLGRHFSGNGDVIAFSYNGDSIANSFGYGVNLPQTPSVGPCITGMLDQELVPFGRITIQDAAIPGALAPLIRFGGWFIARRTRSRTGPGAGGFWSEVHTVLRGITMGAVARTQTFLVMSRDDANGVLELSRKDRAKLSWEGIAGHELFTAVSQRLAALSAVLRGRFVLNPMWTGRRRRLLSVHPLGGCRMGHSCEDGVVNTDGQVFRGPATGTEASAPKDSSSPDTYHGLYVCDGSIVPAAIGRNPALTIAALAERIAQRFILRPSLPPPTASPDADVPGDAVAASASETSGEPSIRYAERLTGTIAFNGSGQEHFEVVLHISADSVEALIEDRRHEARIVGVARIGPREAGREWMLSNSWMNVLASDPRRPDTRLLVYRLQLTRPIGRQPVVGESNNGIERLFIRGHKTINLVSCRKGLWRASTSFDFAVHTNESMHLRGPADAVTLAGNPRETTFAGDCDWTDQHATEEATNQRRIGADWITLPSVDAHGRGHLRGNVRDVLRMAASFEIRHEPKRARRFLWLARYTGFFLGQLLQARFPLLQRTTRIDPLNRPRLDVRKAPADNRRLDATVPPRFLLTRYDPEPGVVPAGHVIVAPGIGMSTDGFRAGHTPFVTYLTTNNYVVWLLDYRGSDLLDASLTQFDLDDLVTDFKDAIARVHAEAGTPVRIVAHCVASLVTTMLLLKHGADLNTQLASVVLSSSHAFIDMPIYNRVMAWLRAPKVLRMVGFEPVFSTDIDPRSSWRVRLLDKILKLQPTVEQCSSAVCRRTRFMYGEVVHHTQIDRHTHDQMYDMFDRTNLETFDHLTRMTRAGRIVDRHGRNVYLKRTNVEALEIPITFLFGSKNGLFRPGASGETVSWFKTQKPEYPDLFAGEEIPGYGHLDLFIGKNAATEVYPKILAALQRTGGPSVVPSNPTQLGPFARVLLRIKALFGLAPR